MVFLSPPNSNGLLLSTFQARTNPPLTRALAYNTYILSTNNKVLNHHPTLNIESLHDDSVTQSTFDIEMHDDYSYPCA